MKIVSFTKVNKVDSILKASASIKFADGRVIHDVRILEGDNGLFISFKDEQMTNCSKKLLNEIEEIMFDEYDKEVIEDRD